MKRNLSYCIYDDIDAVPPLFASFMNTCGVHNYIIICSSASGIFLKLMSHAFLWFCAPIVHIMMYRPDMPLASITWCIDHVLTAIIIIQTVKPLETFPLHTPHTMHLLVHHPLRHRRGDVPDIHIIIHLMSWTTTATCLTVRCNIGDSSLSKQFAVLFD